jgi:hypothetical protein
VGNNVSPSQGSERTTCRGEGCGNIDFHTYSHIGNIAVGTWNVEGLTDVKTEQIIDYMIQHSIGVMCIQEVRKLKSEVLDSDRGYQLILSGGSASQREWAGVGFIVSPKVRKSIVGYCQFNNRMASLKLKTTGGVFAILSVYAPHNLKDVSEKHAFYDDLSKLLRKTSTNGPRLIYGDWNARLGLQKAGEGHILGDFGFGREAQHRVEVPNRDLLMEFCTVHGYVVAQSFFQQDADVKVTYHEPNTPPMDIITASGFSMLDLVLVPRQWLNNVTHICSDRYAALASHHFLVRSTLSISLVRPRGQSRPAQLDWTALDNSELRKLFVERASQDLPIADEQGWPLACQSLLDAAQTHLPKKSRPPNKPWITKQTLEIIDKHRHARAQGIWPLEQQLKKQVRKFAKLDRANWLKDLAVQGDWAALRLLRKGARKHQGRLYNAQGDPISSEQRAETFAEHLATVQWRVRPVTLVPEDSPPVAPPLHVDEEPFSEKELCKAIARMKCGKAVKKGDMPIEAYKALAAEKGAAWNWVLDFCNHCWRTKTIPQEWAIASVSMIYKKGDPGFCDNYRPICLLSIGEKLFAAVLKERLLEAGVENVLWRSQFGFRRGCSTEDAIFIARRRIELAKAQRNGCATLLALDWAKAFDSLNTSSLMDSLRRAGLPSSVLSMVDGMLRTRRYYVEDSGVVSALRDQLSGISQGCTLSPLLFIISMSILLHDAVGMLNPAASTQYAAGELAEVVYADDTLLIGVADKHLEEYLRAVYEAGRRYGMELHFGKFQMITTSRSPVSVGLPDGSRTEAKVSMEYLGSILQGDGLADSEVRRRIGIARADFDALAKTWTHSALTWKQKLRVFDSLVESKLLYAMASLTLTVAQQRKLNGFQNRCLRKIIGVKPSYISRVSNATVLAKARHRSATELLLKKRLQLFGKVLRSPPEHPLRRACFIPGTLTPITERYVRRVGRPSREWVREAIAEACKFFGSIENASTLAMQKAVWNTALTNKLGY